MARRLALKWLMVGVRYIVLTIHLVTDYDTLKVKVLRLNSLLIMQVNWYCFSGPYLE